MRGCKAKVLRKLSLELDDVGRFKVAHGQRVARQARHNYQRLKDRYKASAELRRSLSGMLAVFILILLTGCVTPIKESNGLYIKPVATEVRSPFGTNINFTRLQRCTGPEKVVLFYLDADFTNCTYLTPEEQYAFQLGYSQGQGGQIIAGAMNAAAVGAIAATAGSSAASATATAAPTIINKAPRGRW